MGRGEGEIVSASELASWAWCPEAMRPEALGTEPGNRAAIERGVRHHAKKANFEVISGSAIFVGRICLGAAGLLAVVAVLLAVRG